MTTVIILTLFCVPLGLFYLDIGINALKILGYTYILAFAFLIGLNTYAHREANDIAETIAFTGGIVIVLEQVITVTEARKRNLKAK